MLDVSALEPVIKASDDGDKEVKPKDEAKEKPAA